MRIRIFGKRWNRFTRSAPRFTLQDFHRIHKFTLMAHGQETARTLGQIAAEATQGSRKKYEEVFNRLVEETSPTRGKKSNVTYHMLGYLKHRLSRQQKRNLLEGIDQFRAGELDHTRLLRRIRNHFVRYPDSWVSEQTYWSDNRVSPPPSSKA